MCLFEQDGDYAVFERVLAEGCRRVPMRIVAYCLMPNHWHLLLWPATDGTVSRFIGWVTLTHTKRWHSYRQSVGTGHMYQGRFKSFVVQQDAHLLTVCRYVERNAVRAKLVERAEQWRWSTAGQQSVSDRVVPLSTGPVEWLRWVNETESAEQVVATRKSVVKGQPCGTDAWVAQMVMDWGLQATLRSPGRSRRDDRK
ncbi:MAG: transposase [Nitrospira sp.]|jgi:putative transposase|nr:transposase [Nitrospira sp.]MBP6605576.1 transposase [Nitrospira sp.]